MSGCSLIGLVFVAAGAGVAAAAEGCRAGAAFGNEVLLQAVNSLFPECAEISDRTLRVRCGQGGHIAFSLERGAYQPHLEVVGSAEDRRAAERALAEVRQKYAELQIRRVAEEQGYAIQIEDLPSGARSFTLARRSGAEMGGGRITAEIGSGSQVALEAQGFAGNRCIEAMRPFVDALGNEIEHRERRDGQRLPRRERA